MGERESLRTPGEPEQEKTEQKPDAADGAGEEYSHANHRRRMRMQFELFGLDSFSRFEILEMLLYRCNTRRDTNPAAHALLEEKGSFVKLLEEPVIVRGAGEKTAEMLRETGESLTRIYKEAMAAEERMEMDLVYAAAVWNLRRVSGILLIVCDRNNRFTDSRVLEEKTFREVYPLLPEVLDEGEVAHLALSCKNERITLEDAAEAAQYFRDRGRRLGHVLMLEGFVPHWMHRLDG